MFFVTSHCVRLLLLLIYSPFCLFACDTGDSDTYAELPADMRSKVVDETIINAVTETFPRKWEAIGNSLQNENGEKSFQQGKLDSIYSGNSENEQSTLEDILQLWREQNGISYLETLYNSLVSARVPYQQLNALIEIGFSKGR